MRCKAGDLAVTVGDPSGRFNGMIVTCVRFAGSIPCGTHSDYWEIDRILSGCKAPYVSDSKLRPLRDNPGQDETLQWAPAPKKEKA